MSEFLGFRFIIDETHASLVATFRLINKIRVKISRTFRLREDD